MSMDVFWSGFPGPCGGANVEAWHTAKMLRANGIGVTFLPTGGADLSVKSRVESIGCKVVLTPENQPVPPADLGNVSGLRGSVVISMCNSGFISNAHVFRDLNCPIVWSNCMTFCFPDELAHYRRYGRTFEAYHFQSAWQRERLRPILEKHGFTNEQGHLIRGAFSIEDWPFRPRPHEPKSEYVFGRLSRADLDKHSSDTWPIYARAIRALRKECPSRVRVMAWDDRVKKKLGEPGKWELRADLLKSCAEPSDDYMRSLHAMVQINGGAGENWPRVGLEAMATGTPIVTQNQWGWREMIEHGKTGFLIDNDCHDQFAHYISRLGVDEDLRMRVAEAAREKVVNVHANQAEIWDGWRAMLERIAR